MPEAAVHEYRYARVIEDEVGTSGQFTRIQAPAANAAPHEMRPQDPFRGAIPR
jgi:hypothetical protein